MGVLIVMAILANNGMKISFGWWFLAWIRFLLKNFSVE